MKTLKVLARPATSSAHQSMGSTVALVKPEEATRREAQFVLEATQAHEVYLAGSFNGWDPKRSPMQKNRTVQWQTVLRLAPGRYEYRLVLDGEWHNDPKASEVVPTRSGVKRVCS